MGNIGSRVFPMKHSYPVQYRKSRFPHGLEVTLVRTVSHLSSVRSILKQIDYVHVPPKQQVLRSTPAEVFPMQ